MEVYERRNEGSHTRFLSGRLTFPEAIAALDAALAGVIPNLTAEELPRVDFRLVHLTNSLAASAPEEQDILASDTATQVIEVKQGMA
jgi:hypothetical protein